MSYQNDNIDATLHEEDVMMTTYEELLLREATNRALADSKPDVDKEWDSFFASKREDTVIPTHHRKNNFMYIAAAVAAIAVIIVGITGFNFGAAMNQDNVAVVARNASDSVIVTAPEGHKCQVTLADGTKIWLSAGTTVKYPASFNRNDRSVSLRGEAFFDVTKDPEHPFVVNTPYLVTKVFGTQFNIRCYSASDCHVTLVTGSIEVTPIINKEAVAEKAVTLTPGNDVCVTETGNTEVTKIEAAEHLSWQDGTFNFDDVALGDVLGELSIWYHAPVICHDQEILKQKVHLSLDRNISLDQAVDLINSLSVANITVNNGNISVSK